MATNDHRRGISASDSRRAGTVSAVAHRATVCSLCNLPTAALVAKDKSVLLVGGTSCSCRADRRPKFGAVAHGIEGLVERDARGQSGDRMDQGGSPTGVVVCEIDGRRGGRDRLHLAGDIVGGGDGAGGRIKSARPRAKRSCPSTPDSSQEKPSAQCWPFFSI